jgi:hypothetical protein
VGGREIFFFRGGGFKVGSFKNRLMIIRRRRKKKDSRGKQKIGLRYIIMTLTN